ncbi:prepilin-type N-terminal cleavage/methylation domain-containing protein [Evansella clarkii]|uniref:prepilin-type N-terminal cleavage/methylation domain-containing protein n=1 Tax=Evansella clarkii TaxID=79879 RepID=UPI000B43F4D9|nr:prepilin-type N-terminal cleavage/methylation domain-containing protein [Evansella clarkii]
MLKKFLKNQKGLTLIELLVVVVILGIIAAIAVPSIGGLIANSKSDAHIANAQQMINSARLMVSSEGYDNVDKPIKLSVLEDNGYIEKLDGPDGAYNKETSVVNVSFVSATNQYTYNVTLYEGDTRIFNGATAAQLIRDNIGKATPETP